MTSSLLFDPFISNIQEIIDIERLFELICMFLSIFMYLSLYLISLFIVITHDQDNSTRPAQVKSMCGKHCRSSETPSRDYFLCRMNKDAE